MTDEPKREPPIGDIKRGMRVHEIRKALGPNPRKALAQEAFAALLTATGVRRFYGPEISLMEQGKKPLQVDDLLAIAAVDPEKRGELWVAYGPEGPTQSLEELLENAYKLSAEDINRAVTIATRAKPSKKAKKPAAKKRQPRKRGRSG